MQLANVSVASSETSLLNSVSHEAEFSSSLVLVVLVTDFCNILSNFALFLEVFQFSKEMRRLDLLVEDVVFVDAEFDHEWFEFLVNLVSFHDSSVNLLSILSTLVFHFMIILFLLFHQIIASKLTFRNLKKFQGDRQLNENTNNSSYENLNVSTDFVATEGIAAE